jgi:hypothetical protein
LTQNCIQFLRVTSDQHLKIAGRYVQKRALAGIWTRDLCLTKATLYQAELPRQHQYA